MCVFVLFVCVPRCVYVCVSDEMTEGKLTSTTLAQLTKCHETQQPIKPDDSFKCMMVYTKPKFQFKCSFACKCVIFLFSILHMTLDLKYFDIFLRKNALSTEMQKKKYLTQIHSSKYTMTNQNKLKLCFVV